MSHEYDQDKAVAEQILTDTLTEASTLHSRDRKLLAAEIAYAIFKARLAGEREGCDWMANLWKEQRTAREAEQAYERAEDARYPKDLH